MGRRSFAASWALARSHGIRKDAWAESMGISRHHADDLTSGRVKPKLGEYAAIGGGRRDLPWLIKYRTPNGTVNGFYTGAGMSYDELLESGVIYEIADENEDEYPMDGIIGIIHRSPKTDATTVWSTGGKTRELQRRRLRGPDDWEDEW